MPAGIFISFRRLKEINPEAKVKSVTKKKKKGKKLKIFFRIRAKFTFNYLACIVPLPKLIEFNLMRTAEGNKP